MADFHCPLCNKPLARRARKDGSGHFWSCAGYPECKFAQDDMLGVPLLAKCPECGEFLRAGKNAQGPYTACFRKENHSDGKARFFDAEGNPREELKPSGEFFCPECQSPLKYFVFKTGKNAGKPGFACFETALHEDGKPRYYRDEKGRPTY